MLICVIIMAPKRFETVLFNVIQSCFSVFIFDRRDLIANRESISKIGEIKLGNVIQSCDGI